MPQPAPSPPDHESELRAISDALLTWIAHQQIAADDVVRVMSAIIAGTVGSASDTAIDLADNVTEIQRIILAGALDTWAKKQSKE